MFVSALVFVAVAAALGGVIGRVERARADRIARAVRPEYGRSMPYARRFHDRPGAN